MSANSLERNSPSVGLLISVLVRYPEIASVQYDHKDQSLRFSFLLARKLEEEETDKAREIISSSLETYFYLQNKTARLKDVVIQPFDTITTVQLKRDVASLTQEEISMVTEIIKDRFGSDLVTELPEGSGDEDQLMQDEVIEEMLDDLRESQQHRNLVAFREEGRVLVYNK